MATKDSSVTRRSANRPRFRILAVDDEENVRRLYRNALVGAVKGEGDDAPDALHALEASLFGGGSDSANAPAADGPAPGDPFYDLVLCRQGDEAVEVARVAARDGKPFAVAYIDVRMPPGPDGVWAAAQIRTILPDTHIVIVTGFSDMSPAEIARRVPPSDKLLYVQKPFHASELRQFSVALGTKWQAERALREAKASLEGKVVERTADLEKANAELRREIEQRGKAEAALRRLSAAVEQASDIVAVTDPQGTIQYVNPAFDRVTGYTCAEALGKTFRILKSGKHELAFYEQMWNTIARGQTWRGRLTNRHKSGELYEEDCSISPVCDAAGEIVNYVAVKHDVTAVAKLEAQIRRAQKMEALGTLAGGMAHDFNNLLMGIMGYVELAGVDLPKDHPSRDYLREAMTAGNRARDLVGQVLSWGRQPEQERRPVLFIPIVKEVAKLLRASFPAAVVIRQHLSALNDSVVADPVQLHQVIVNFGINAEYAMRPAGGVLELAIENVVVEEAQRDLHVNVPPGPYVRLSVSDTGCGISRENQDRIFDPFFTTKASGEGSGLGLTVVHGIVTSHGGCITVYSEPGRGTTFRVYLPCADQAASVDADLYLDLPKGKERVLFVDDEAVVRSVGALMMSALGYRVTAKGSAAEALAIIRGAPHSIDIVVADQSMAQMGGEALAHEILRIRPDMPIILCSGFSQAASLQKAREAGIREFLSKPFSSRELSLAMRRALGDRSEESQSGGDASGGAGHPSRGASVTGTQYL
ncbi:MAG: hypothetical protein A3K19_18580 [Lentisphaerae bacterium RIFOXYB12_FULL_65_16]|nr:MAG: hypothetical protein A3K18_01020 [Lentisphaerae bacterium RIFOXYA12_64_32]OGV92352.1 MAG: hypothetical protein A3K19_18580 [Lentisphaerae bacterium RIFOXYB12_FULL_65_16]